MMWYPNPATARLHHDKELRTLYACIGVSVVLHGLAMLSFPALHPADRQDEARALTALFATRSEPAAVAPVPVPRKQREQRESEVPAPSQKPVDPVPAAVATAEPAPPTPQPAASPSLASIAPDPVASDLPARPSPEAIDASLLNAYRLALIDAARRYKRYPVQAMERGWEGRVEVRVVVGADGTIKSALVRSSSRYQVLDEQALEMVKRAFNALAQVRPAPRGREFTLDIPVVFELQTG